MIEKAGAVGKANASSALGAYVREFADEFCNGRAVFVLEGGYDLRLLSQGVEETIRAYDAGRSTLGAPAKNAIPPQQRDVLERALS